MSTIKAVNKFLREQGGVGPECYPGKPGEYTKAWCLQHANLKYTQILNNVYAEATAELSSDGVVPSDALYGNEFEESIDNTVPMTATYDIVSQFTSERALYKAGYNAQHATNLVNRPAGLLKMDDITVYAEEKLTTITDHAIRFDYYANLIAGCFCEDVGLKQLEKYTFSGSQTSLGGGEADTGTPGVEETLTLADTPANNLSADNIGIPEVFGRYQVKANLIERRSDYAIFGVCQRRDGLTVSRIFFGDTVVYENGAVVVADKLTDVTFEKARYKDLITVTIHGANITQLVTQYGGIVNVEILENGTAAYSTTNTVPGNLIGTDVATGVVLVNNTTTGAVDVIGDVSVPATSPAIAALNTAGAVIHNTKSYINDTISDVYSGGVNTITPIMSAPLGVHTTADTTYIINNTKLIDTQTGDYYGLFGPNPTAAFFAANKGITADGSQMFVVDPKTRKTVKHALPVFSYNAHLFNDTYIALINTVNGEVSILKDTVPTRRLTVTGVPLKTPLSGRTDDTGTITLISATDEVIKLNMATGDATYTGETLPTSVVQYTTRGTQIIGETAGGDVVTQERTATASGTIADMISVMSDGTWTGVNEPITGHILSNSDRTYLSYLLDGVNNAYNTYTANEGGKGLVTRASAIFNDTPMLVSEREQTVDTQEDTPLEGDEGTTFTAVSPDYLAFDTDVASTTSEVKRDFATTALLTQAQADERAIQYVNRETWLTNPSRLTASVYANLKFTPGLNADNLDISDNVLTMDYSPDKVGTDTGAYTSVPVPPNTNTPYTEPSYSFGAFFETYALSPTSVKATVTPTLSIARAINTLPTEHQYRLQQQPDVLLDVAFPSPPVNPPTTTTYAELLADDKKNLFNIGENEWVQYETAVQLTPTTYRLSGIMRGRFLTAGHEHTRQAGDTVVFYDGDNFTVEPTQKPKKPVNPRAFVTDIQHIYRTDVAYYRFSDIEIKSWFRMKAAGYVTDIDDVLRSRFFVGSLNQYLQIEHTDTYSDIPDRLNLQVAAVGDATPSDGDIGVFFKARATKFGATWYVGYKPHIRTDITYTSLKDRGKIHATIKVGNSVVHDEELPYKRIRTWTTGFGAFIHTTDALEIVPTFNPYYEDLDIALRHV